ncbi:aminoglycoside phosphotransferase [Acidiferrobacter thiooxydans]|uniref:Aminoglycoside phosphotransferase n=1 Tax=Acidiferrobacter thiooxydans TaxID=163359 RepID=A0A368HM02_9GAMM|nr:aminoglycoside phosphotransferase [Acidiferrobacter thiooxydans]
MAALIQFTRRILGTSGFTIAPASSDASFRRYFRITSGGESWVAMDAPPNKEPLAPFVRVAQRFGALGLHVPKVLACDLDTGLALLTDLGHTPYLDKLDDATADRLYGDALGALVVLQGGTFSDPDFLPPYDEVLLRREMELFPEWYLRGYLGHTITGGERRLLDQAFDDLSANALHQPQVWVHRDYHSRNLLVNTLHNPGILDFQDAVRGPITYDLVSLLKDCYVAWPRERVVDWVKGYCQLARESGLHQCDDEAVFLEWFDRMGIQRHLKVAGIFARLHLRDGKPGYLGDLPLTMHYLREATALYPDLCDLHTFLRALPESP